LAPLVPIAETHCLEVHLILLSTSFRPGRQPLSFFPSIPGSCTNLSNGFKFRYLPQVLRQVGTSIGTAFRFSGFLDHALIGPDFARSPFQGFMRSEEDEQLFFAGSLFLDQFFCSPFNVFLPPVSVNGGYGFSTNVVPTDLFFSKIPSFCSPPYVTPLKSYLPLIVTESVLESFQVSPPPRLLMVAPFIGRVRPVQLRISRRIPFFFWAFFPPVSSIK